MSHKKSISISNMKSIDNFKQKLRSQQVSQENKIRISLVKNTPSSFARKIKPEQAYNLE